MKTRLKEKMSNPKANSAKQSELSINKKHR